MHAVMLITLKCKCSAVLITVAATLLDAHVGGVPSHNCDRGLCVPTVWQDDGLAVVSELFSFDWQLLLHTITCIDHHQNTLGTCATLQAVSQEDWLESYIVYGACKLAA